MGLPATSRAPVVTVATQVVLTGRLLLGVNVIALLLTAYATVPAIGVAAGHATEKLAAIMVEGSIGSLNPAVTRVLVETPIASRAGKLVITVGAMVSGVPPVVKDHTKSLAKE